MGLLSCLIEQERFAEAVPLAKRELGREPDKREFWGLLVNAELVTDRREQALNLLECARRLGATDAHMLAVLGDLYLDQSLAEPALACYRQAAALNQAPVSRLLSGFEALILSRHATEAAALGETLARRLEEFTPRQRLRFRSLRASLLASQGKAEAAIREYRLVLEQDPIHGDSLLALGDLLLPAKPQEARELFARAARLDAFQVRAWTALARLAVERNDFARAAEFVQRALARKPDPALERYLAQIRAAMP
jgi:tetratricopeptide (TPR) repeat protein